MKFIRILSDAFDLPENPVKKGSILTVVDELSDKVKAADGWWITPTEVKAWYTGDKDFQHFSDEEPNTIYQYKNIHGVWVDVGYRAYWEYKEHGTTTRALYEVKS